MDRSGLDGAISAWISAIGADHVVQDPVALHAASTATFATHQRVHSILRPGSREEVQGCLQIANRYGIPVYPVSTGKNWGYGSRVPSQDGVLIELARLNRIVDFDEELAYVTIEPGVTQRQLFGFLRERKSSLWMDATGASPDCSIIGNTLERGFGHTPMADHCGNACALEVVLPSGDCIQTGFAACGATKAGALGRWGVGPSVDGLFSQSNLGIVTRMTVWLMPEPEAFQAFFFMCRDDHGLGAVVDALRPLRLKGSLRSAIHIGNDYKVLTGTSQYPWREMDGRTPLDRQTMARFRQRLNIGAWNGAGALYGTRAHVRDARRQVRRALRGKVERLQFVDDRLLRMMRRFAGPFRMLSGWDISRTLQVLAPVYGLMKGVPTDAPMASVYWRKKGEIPTNKDPDRDGCGLIWCSPVLPNVGSHAREVTRLATEIVLEHGFEPQMSLSLATERSAICIVTISYDRAMPGEDERALTCYRALSEALLVRGYPPYRLPVIGMDFYDRMAVSGLLDRVKTAVDPNGVLAPRRYDALLALSRR